MHLSGADLEAYDQYEKQLHIQASEVEFSIKRALRAKAALEEARCQKEEERCQKEEECRQKEEERRQKEEAFKRIAELEEQLKKTDTKRRT